MKNTLAAAMRRRVLASLACGLLGLAPLAAQTDDFGNTATTAALINPNTSVSGTLSPGGDVDYFRFTLNFAAHVVISTTGGIDTSGSLRNSSDVEIVKDDDSGTYPNFRIERDLAAGTYYVRVSGYDSSVTGPYVLNLEVDDGNTAATATSVELNARLSASLYTGGDVDYFRFTLAATTRVVLYTSGGLDTIGSLRNSSDVEIVGNNDASATDLNFRIVRDLDAGTYLVRVTAPPTVVGAYTMHFEKSGVATLTTAAATSIGDTTATLGGEITSDGGATITERGVVYGKLSGPTVGGTGVIAVTSGFGTGSFIAGASGLTPGTIYYARAYAVSSTGTTYGNEVQFLTSGTTPPTTLVDDHGDTFATATLVSPNSSTKGQINSSADADFFRIDLPAPSDLFVITSGTLDTFGRLYDSAGNLLTTSDNNGTDVNFRIEMDLPAGTYYIAVTGAGIGRYTLGVQATIRAPAPTVSSASATSITASSALLGGTVVSDNGAPVTQRGVVYNTAPEPALGTGALVLTSGTGTGVFSATATGLALDTHYYARAFAVNSGGTGYGETVEFTTLDDVGNTAATASNAALNADIAATLTSAGDVDYFKFILTEPRFVVVFTTGGVSTAGSLRNASDAELAAASSGGAGANFRITRALEAGTYYVRVSGMSGTLGSYTLRIETSTSASVSTAVSAVSPTGATLGGNVTSDGGTAVTQRGFVYAIAPTPTLANGTVVNSGSGPGSFSAAVALPDATTLYARAFAVNTAGVAYGNEVQFTTPSGTRLTNLSIRGRAGDGDQALLVGFNLAGTGTKQLLLRGVGPALAAFGVTGALPDPFLQLSSPQTAIASNEDWGSAPAVVVASASAGAFPLPAGSKDAAMVQTLNPGTYNLRVGGGTGAALVEVYDLGPIWTPELVNVSTRAQAGTGADTLIAGFTIAGSGSRSVLVRAVGPTLATFGVSGALADPRLEVFRSGVAAPISANDNWGGGAALMTAFERVGAFALPAGSSDAAALVTLQAGSYTVQVSGAGNTTGVALLEIYELP